MEITDALWQTLLRDLPTTAILIVGVWAAAKYLDRWLSRFAATNEAAAEQRQSQIIVLLEKLVITTAETDKKLSAVIERNTVALDRISDASLRQAETLSRLVQADSTQATQLRDLTASMIEHYKDVASRPCQIAVPTKRRPQTPRAGEQE